MYYLFPHSLERMARFLFTLSIFSKLCSLSWYWWSMESAHCCWARKSLFGSRWSGKCPFAAKISRTGWKKRLASEKAMVIINFKYAWFSLWAAHSEVVWNGNKLYLNKWTVSTFLWRKGIVTPLRSLTCFYSQNQTIYVCRYDIRLTAALSECRLTLILCPDLTRKTLRHYWSFLSENEPLAWKFIEAFLVSQKL